jgi:N-succinyldiaminopimelate aminotransferase
MVSTPGRWQDVARAAGLLREDGSAAATIFAEMSALAAGTDAINLGQGFPDLDGPNAVLEAAVSAVRGGANQYPPGRGKPELRQAIAAHQKRFYGLEVDADREVLVTVGATEGIAAAVLALCEPGDEVVMFEPYFDSYAATVELAGAVRRTVPLRFPDYAVDVAALEAAFTDRTRLLLLNSPHNPTGRVLSRAELTAIAEIAIRRDVLVVTDEVYEHLTFDGLEHVPIATLDGMAGRTLTISSAGKTFSVTGWKIGWVSGPPHLVDAVTTVKQFLSYASGTPLQVAVAEALALPDDTYRDLAQRLQHGRDILSAGLEQAGFIVAPSSGTYFVVADAAPLGFDDGMDFCLRLPSLAGLVAVPIRVLHDDPDGAGARSLVRFAFCKRPELLAEAVTRLQVLRRRV